MSTVFLRPARGPSEPQTHALIIGVDAYPYAANDPRYRLPILGSPTVSALAFRAWLESEYENRTAPLGSVELLLSPGALSDIGPYRGVDRAGAPETHTAFRSWKARARAHPANVLMFYFCGHGVERGVSCLLLEDFARYENPWLGAFNFGATYHAMKSWNVATQCFFIDACRSTPVEVALTSDFSVAALDLTTHLRFPPCDAPIYSAAAEGHEAHGTPGKVSDFTSLLLRALRTYGAGQKNGGHWRVDTASLGQALLELQYRASAAAGFNHFGSTRADSNLPASALHDLQDEPMVLTQLGCIPGEANACAELQVRRKDRPSMPLRRRPQSEPWRFELSPGTYDMAAQFARPGFNAGLLEDQPVFPPVQQYRIEVRG